MEIIIKTTNEKLKVKIEFETYNLLFVTDQYGRYLRIRKENVIIIDK